MRRDVTCACVFRCARADAGYESEDTLSDGGDFHDDDDDDVTTTLGDEYRGRKPSIPIVPATQVREARVLPRHPRLHPHAPRGPCSVSRI